jgi:hypothetical protein
VAGHRALDPAATGHAAPAHQPSADTGDEEDQQQDIGEDRDFPQHRGFSSLRSAAFDAVFTAAGVPILETPVRAPICINA